MSDNSYSTGTYKINLVWTSYDTMTFTHQWKKKGGKAQYPMQGKKHKRFYEREDNNAYASSMVEHLLNNSFEAEVDRIATQTFETIKANPWVYIPVNGEEHAKQLRHTINSFRGRGDKEMAGGLLGRLRYWQWLNDPFAED